MLRAKFRCESKTVSLQSVWDVHEQIIPNQPVYAYRFYAVAGEDGENKKFFASTPIGSLQIGVVRDDSFELGRDYYLDFTLATS